MQHDQPIASGEPSTLLDVFRLAPVGLGVIRDRVFVDVNDRFCSLLGYQRDELLGASARILYASDEEHGKVGAMADLPVGVPSTIVETELACKAGTRLVVQLNGIRIEDPGLAPVFVFAMVDVTRERRAEAALARQNELLSRMAAAETLSQVLDIGLRAVVGTHGVDCGAVYLLEPRSGDLMLAAHLGIPDDWQQAVRRIPAGSPQADLVMAKQHVFGHYQALFGASARKRIPLRGFGTVPVLHHNQVVACLHVASVTADAFSDAAQAHVRSIASQIGVFVVRASSELALRESERRRRELADSLPQAVFEVTADGVIRFVNANSLRMFGFDTGDFDRGVRLLDVLDASDRPRAGDNFQKVPQGQELPTIECGGRRRDGTTFPLEVTQGRAPASVRALCPPFKILASGSGWPALR